MGTGGTDELRKDAVRIALTSGLSRRQVADDLGGGLIDPEHVGERPPGRRGIARDPERASARAKSDAALSVKIDKAWAFNRKLYGARKVWHVLLREGEYVVRCTVERLMRSLGIKEVIRGKKVITTNPDTSLPCPYDNVNRLFKADRPSKLWVSDFTYVPTWSGTVYVAFVIDVFARRIVG